MKSLDDFLAAVLPWLLVGLMALVLFVLCVGLAHVWNSPVPQSKDTAHVLKSISDGDAQIEVVEINGNNYVIVATYRGVAIVPETKTLAEGR